MVLNRLKHHNAELCTNLKVHAVASLPVHLLATSTYIMHLSNISLIFMEQPTPHFKLAHYMYINLCAST